MRADLGAARPRREVRVRLLVRHGRDGALDPHLAAERVPEEEQGRARVRLELRSLAARRVRMEDKPAVVEALGEHHA